MIKIQRNRILQTRNQRFHIQRMQIHPQQLMPITKNHIRRRIIRTLARKLIIHQLIPLKTATLMPHLIRRAFLRTHPPTLARILLQTVRTIRLQIQTLRTGTQQSLGTVMTIVRAHQTEITETIIATFPLIGTIVTVLAIVA